MNSVNETPVKTQEPAMPTNLSTINSSKSYILDPLSVIIKLAILSFSPIGTKINISKNCILLQQVGAFQSFVRFLQKNNKNDIQYIYNPIELACEHFLGDDMLQEFPNITKLFESAINGLKRLIETYSKSPVIILCLNYYINLITNFIGNSYNDELFKIDNMTLYYEQKLLDKLSQRWTEDKLQLVLELNDYLIKNDVTQDNVTCLEMFMKGMDEETQTIVNFVEE